VKGIGERNRHDAKDAKDARRDEEVFYEETRKTGMMID
jgi:hypothetical protein